MTIDQYNDIQYNANIESMELRTHDEISGKLKYPSAFQKWQYHIYDQFSLNIDHNIVMDEMVFQMARDKFNNELLDVENLLN